MSFSVTSIKGVDPPGNTTWYKYHNCPPTPFTVDLSKREGLIGEFLLDGSGSGPGLSWEIEFSISGTSPTDVTSTRTGHITLSSDPWPSVFWPPLIGAISRPDHAYVTFVFDGSAPYPFAYEVPTLRYIDDTNIMIEWFKDKSTFGMNVTMDKTLVSKLCDLAIAGIFAAHEKAADWAMGKVW